MKRLALLIAAFIALALAPAARAEYGLTDFDVLFTAPDGSPAAQAGSHPFEWTTSFDLASELDPDKGEVLLGSIKDLEVEQPLGIAVNPFATPRCSSIDFIDIDLSTKMPACTDSTAIGFVSVRIQPVEGTRYFTVPVFNLEPPPGSAAKFGFNVVGVPVTIEGRVSQEAPYPLQAHLTDISQAVPFFGSVFTLWGNPSAKAHDPYRGHCLNGLAPREQPEPVSIGQCPANTSPQAFATLPASCTGPLRTDYATRSWQEPETTLTGFATTHDDSVPPNPLGMSGCSELRFSPTIDAVPTSRSAQSPTGLDFSLNVQDEGLLNPEGLAQSTIRKTEVTLQEGFTTNPSLAEGLNVCTEADLARESASSEAGSGCPNASKIGSVEIETPLLRDKLLKGSLFIAKPYENPFNSLLALYIVIQNEELGSRSPSRSR